MNSQENSQDCNAGDSDDEIAELRFQALLTKRENEAEVSPAHEPRPLKENFMQMNQPLSNYQPDPYEQQPYMGMGRQRQIYKPYLQTFSQQIASSSVNSSNIVVLTSSTDSPEHNHHHWGDGRGRGRGFGHRGRWPRGRGGFHPHVPMPAISGQPSAPQLILPQDKYAAAQKGSAEPTDPNKAKLSARMRRLQGSDSDSENSDSDSSDDSSTDSSSSDSNSSSSDSSSSDTDSDSDSSSAPAAAKKPEKLIKKDRHGKDEPTHPPVDANKIKNGIESQVKQPSTGISKNSGAPASNLETVVKKGLPCPANHNDSVSAKTSLAKSSLLEKPRSGSPERKLNKSDSPGHRQMSQSPRRYRTHSPRFRRTLSKSPLSFRRTPSRRSRSVSPKRFSPRRGRTPVRKYSRSPVYKRRQSKSPLRMTHSPLRRYGSKSPARNISPISPRRFRSRSKSPFTRARSRSPIRRRSSRSPRFHSRSPYLLKRYSSKSPVPRRFGSKSPIARRYGSRSPALRRYGSKSPIPRKYGSRSPLSPRYRSKSPLPFRRFSSRSPLPSKRYGSRTPPRRSSRSPNRVISPLPRRKLSRSPSFRKYGKYSPGRSRSPIYKSRKFSPVSPMRRKSSLSPPVKKYMPRSPISQSGSAPKVRSHSPLPHSKRLQDVSPGKVPASPQKIRRIGSLSPRPKGYPSPTAKQPPHASPGNVRVSPVRKYGSRSPYRALSPGSQNRTPLRNIQYMRHASPRDPNYLNTLSSPYQARRTSPLPGGVRKTLLSLPETSVYYGSEPDSFPGARNIRGNAEIVGEFNPPAGGSFSRGMVGLRQKHYITHDEPPPHQWTQHRQGPPPMHIPPPRFSNIHQPYPVEGPDNIWPPGPPGPPGPVHQEEWNIGPPPRGPRAERFQENIHMLQPHPAIRGRGNMRGVRGHQGRVHARLGQGRGMWHGDEEEVIGFEQGPPQELFIRENHPRILPHPERFQDRLPWEIDDGKISAVNKLWEKPGPRRPRSLSPPLRRIPKGPQTPPYSPKKEPSPLEWEKRRAHHSDRTPTLSPSPSRKFLVPPLSDQKNIKLKTPPQRGEKQYMERQNERENIVIKRDKDSFDERKREIDNDKRRERDTVERRKAQHTSEERREKGGLSELRHERDLKRRAPDKLLVKQDDKHVHQSPDDRRRTEAVSNDGHHKANRHPRDKEHYRRMEPKDSEEKQNHSRDIDRHGKDVTKKESDRNADKSQKETARDYNKKSRDNRQDTGKSSDSSRVLRKEQSSEKSRQSKLSSRDRAEKSKATRDMPDASKSDGPSDSKKAHSKDRSHSQEKVKSPDHGKVKKKEKEQEKVNEGEKQKDEDKAVLKDETITTINKEKEVVKEIKDIMSESKEDPIKEDTKKQDEEMKTEMKVEPKKAEIKDEELKDKEKEKSKPKKIEKRKSGASEKKKKKKKHRDEEKKKKKRKKEEKKKKKDTKRKHKKSVKASSSDEVDDSPKKKKVSSALDSSKQRPSWSEKDTEDRMRRKRESSVEKSDDRKRRDRPNRQDDRAASWQTRQNERKEAEYYDYDERYREGSGEQGRKDSRFASKERDYYKKLDQTSVQKGNKGFVVTVWSGMDRQVMPDDGRHRPIASKGANTKNERIPTSRVPVHLRLGRTIDDRNTEKGRERAPYSSRQDGRENSDRKGNGARPSGKNPGRRQNNH